MRSRTGSSVVALASLGLGLLGAPASTQDWRGNGRFVGVVTDDAGKPLAGVTIKADCPERGGGTTLRSDKNGRWVLGGVVACSWNLDFSADGYQTKQISVNLPGESSRLRRITVPLTPAGASPQLRAAARAADDAYKAGRFAEARAEYEKLLAASPELATTIHQQIGFSLIQEKQYGQAVEHLEKVLAADPANAQIRAIAAQAALEGRMMDKARQLLAGLDESKIGSPDVFFNMGVNFLNAGATDDAIAYFGKAIALDPKYVDGYYRRALGYLGQGRTAAARADFQKVLELQPDGEMASLSRKALEQIE